MFDKNWWFNQLAEEAKREDDRRMEEILEAEEEINMYEEEENE